jgi:ABC-type transporter Mla MlaB component
MVLRATAGNEDGTHVVALHGRLDVESLEVFAAIAAELTVGTRCDLSHLQSADTVGLALLVQLGDRGVQMVGASPYIELCLDQARKTVPW